MKTLEEIADRIHNQFETKTEVRDQALKHARMLTRSCSKAIRAVHRDEKETAESFLAEASALAESLRTDLKSFPDLYFAGYTQDALKEFAEANIVDALVNGGALPGPEELQLEYDTYLKGLAESVGEMRRRCLDILRGGYNPEAERLLSHMDDIYGVLVTMDFPDAITKGLRRQTDIIRGIVERTRGDLTISLRQEHLESQLRKVEERLNSG